MNQEKNKYNKKDYQEDFLEKDLEKNKDYITYMEKERSWIRNYNNTEKILSKILIKIY